MPGSFQNFDAAVAYIIRSLAPRTCLDIGCGAGKYGKMVAQETPTCHRIGIEVEPRYVEQFQLRDLYNEVRVGDGLEVLSANQGEFFDLAIIGDCIEHMPKSAGLDLLNFLSYRTQYLIVLAPEFSVQGSVNGIDSETHVSVWSEQDFLWHDRWAWDNCFTISAFVLRGYQAATMEFNRLIDGLNSAQVPLTDFYGKNIVRPAAFKKEIRLRQDMMDKKFHNFRPL